MGGMEFILARLISRWYGMSIKAWRYWLLHGGRFIIKNTADIRTDQAANVQRRFLSPKVLHKPNLLGMTSDE
jgi:hypothetical protein